MSRVVFGAATAAAETNVAPKLEWSTYNKHFDTNNDPYLFNNQFETEISIDTMHTLTWKQKELRDSRFKNPGHQSFKKGDPGRKAGEDANVLHRICCPSSLFHPYYLILSHLHYKIWKNNDIIKGDRDNNEGVLHYENRFQAFR